jgi:hypothetical protein
MDISKLLGLPSQARERLLDMTIAGKLDIDGLNVVTDPDRHHGNMWGTSEVDYFVFDGSERNQYTEIHGFEVGVDKLVFTEGTVIENRAYREGDNVAYTYGDGVIFGNTMWVYDVPTFHADTDVVLL